jgi:glycosyltransferase involved in cell wall biosynthesis
MGSQPSSGPAGVGPLRPRVFYVSYDGVGEPLGRSQVLSYLFRLTGEFEITLFSFEKSGVDLETLHAELRAHGVSWRPLRYRKHPPVLSTFADVLSGVCALVAASRSGGRPAIVHVRSYVPALIALWARRFTGGRLLFDIRGFWVDERIEGGIWPQSRLTYRLLYRIGKLCERRFFAKADAVVTLTQASVAQIRAWTPGSGTPIVVIPTCVDLDRFPGLRWREGPPRLVWCGSIGTWYRFDLVPALTTALGLELEVLTRQTREARALLGEGTSANVRSLAPQEVAEALYAGDIGLSLCLSSFSKSASAPTRFAEYLASGMAVIVNRGVGDLAETVERHRVGVVLEDESGEAIAAAALAARTLNGDPALSQRCQRIARELFDVEVGSRRYADLYRQLLPG